MEEDGAMRTSLSNRRPPTPVDNALRYARAGSESFGKTTELAAEGSAAFDGYEISVEEIRQDRPGKSVAASGKALQVKSHNATRKAEDSYSAQLEGLENTGAAIQSIDGAYGEVPVHLHDELEMAQQYLDQWDQASRTEYYISSALGTIHGGAGPYIDSAAMDTGSTNVSYSAGTLGSLLEDAKFDLKFASDSGYYSVRSINDAIAILEEVQEELAS